MRKQDAVFGLVSVAVNPKGRDMTWQYFQDNSAKLLAQYEVRLKSEQAPSSFGISIKCIIFQGGFLLARLVKHLTENFASEAKAQEVEAYFAANHFPGTERTVSQSIETIRLNAAWLERDLESITSYLTPK